MPLAIPCRYPMLGAISSGSTFIRCNSGSAPIKISAAHKPVIRASHKAWRTIGPISPWVLAPKRWATLGVVASKIPDISKNTGTQIELPSATAARSRGPTRPAITASTKPMAVVAICEMMMGSASASSARTSVRTRAGRLTAMEEEGWVTEFTGLHPQG